MIVTIPGAARSPQILDHLEDRNLELYEGILKATLWAVEDLDVTISGLGRVEYYGIPAVKKSVSGPGNVTSLGNPF